MSDQPTYDDVLAVLKDVKAREGQTAVRQLLVAIGGVTAASDLDAKHYADVIAACEGNARASIKPDGSLNHASILSKWNSSGARFRGRVQS